MSNVIDVSSSGEPEAAVLTRTGKSGLLGGSYLRSKPLADYLGDAELPHYVVRNKKSGLRIESAGPADAAGRGGDASENGDAGRTVDGDRDGEADGDGEGDRDGDADRDGEADHDGDADHAAVPDNADNGNHPENPDRVASGAHGGNGHRGDLDRASADGSEHLEPASDYQALAAITDVRIVFVVGTPDGDRSASIPLSDVATVDVDSGILGSELSITTAADDRYVFPCRGDLDPIAEYVDRGAQAWTRAYTLLDRARDSLETAVERRSASAFDEAIDAIDDGVAAVDDARDRIATFGSGAARALDPEASELRRTLEDRRRAIHAEHGVDAHERARRHWGHRNYERAHAAFREAQAALRRAQDLEATDGIADRLERIDEELDELAAAPLSYAEAMVEEAADSEDARTTAQCWEVAIERYRDVYALDWAREDERFRGDPEAIRERILDAVDELVAHRIAGVEDRLDEAEWHRQSDDLASARHLVEDALDALDRTERLVDELTTREYPELRAARRDAQADAAALPDP